MRTYNFINTIRLKIRLHFANNFLFLFKFNKTLSNEIFIIFYNFEITSHFRCYEAKVHSRLSFYIRIRHLLTRCNKITRIANVFVRPNFPAWMHPLLKAIIIYFIIYNFHQIQNSLNKNFFLFFFFLIVSILICCWQVYQQKLLKFHE